MEDGQSCCHSNEPALLVLLSICRSRVCIRRREPSIRQFDSVNKAGRQCVKFTTYCTSHKTELEDQDMRLYMADGKASFI